MKRLNAIVNKAILALVLFGFTLLGGIIFQSANAQTDTTLVAVDDYVNVNAASVTIAVMSNDILPALGASLVSIGCGPSYGTAFMNPAGVITYSFSAGAIMNDEFCYVICDFNSVCDTAMVYIIVSTGPGAPVANDDYVQTETDSAVTIFPMLNDEFDSSVSISISSPPINGTISATGSGAFAYIPNPGFEGDDFFTYTICNTMGDCSTATVYIYVGTSIGGEAPIAVDDTFYTYTDMPIVIHVLGNDIWSPAMVIDIVSISDPENGTIVEGAIALYYTPNPGFTGIDQFTYVICTGNTPEYCDTALVTIIVESDTTTTGCNTFSCVWPGDANNNGIANNYDILTIGLGYGFTGPARTDASLDWIGQYADNWDDFLGTAGTVGFLNAKFADCDGNGIIEAADTLAVSLNYGMTHGKNEGDADEDSPVLTFELPLDVEENTWVSADVILGNATNGISDIHGLAFSFAFDAGLVQASSVSFTFDSDSWLGSPENLSFSKRLTDGNADVAYTRTDRNNVSGYGKIGTVNFFVIDNIDGKNETAPLLEISASNAYMVNAEGILTQLNTLSASTEISTSIIPNQPTLIDGIKVYPNPANVNSEIFISAGNAQVNYITVINAAEQTVFASKVDDSTSIKLMTNGYAPGLYLMQLQTNEGIISRKIILND